MSSQVDALDKTYNILDENWIGNPGIEYLNRTTNHLDSQPSLRYGLPLRQQRKESPVRLLQQLWECVANFPLNEMHETGEDVVSPFR